VVCGLRRCFGGTADQIIAAALPGFFGGPASLFRRLTRQEMRSELRLMNAILPGFALAALTASVFADGCTITTLTGRTFPDAQVKKFEEDAIIVSYTGGITKIAIVNLPPEARTALGVDDFLREKQKGIAEAKNAQEIALTAKLGLELSKEILASDYPAELVRQIAGYNSEVNEVNHWLTLASKEETPSLIAEYKARAEKVRQKLERDLKSFDEYKALLEGAGKANAAKIATAVSGGNSYIGMPRAALRVSKGEPSAIYIRKTPFGESEQWVFKSDAGFRFYYFEGGRLTGEQQ
jgi:hypothetical protein